ncbi:Elongator complex protein 4 [Myxozyma melibiosi]|uniref:Elongator complex protein 4 n=1 Tax=Myxozyma melibiosi TaxID=54550 RepID=A0ABR1F0D3_9ASCO
MSFRKRNEPILSSARHPPPIVTPSTTLRRPRPTPSSTTTSHPSPATAPPSSPARRPSPFFSSHTIHSTGTSTLDKLLLHGGQPLGTSLLLEESAATDFASVAARCYAAQGVCNSDTVIVVGVEEGRWGAELPAKAEPKRGSRKASSSSSGSGGDADSKKQELKIAWRYKLNDPNSKAATDNPEAAAEDEEYCTPFNITARALHPPSTLKYIAVQPTDTYDAILARLTDLLADSRSTYQQQHQQPLQTIRLIIPSFLNPTVYSDVENCFDPPKLLKFLSSLRSILRANEHRMSALITLSTSLFDSSLQDVNELGDEGNAVLLPWIETLVDGVIRLIPTPSLSKTSGPPKTSTKDADDKQGSFQGFVDILKVPIVSDRGAMVVRKTEYAFKVGKNGLRIEKWGIPVIIDEGAEKNTTQSLDY